MLQKGKKSISIRLKLIGVIIPIVLIIILSFFILSRNMVLKNAQEDMAAQAQAYTGEINSWANRIFGELQIYQDTIEDDNFENDEEILKYMEKSVDKNEAYPIGLYMGDSSGVYLDGSGWVPDADWVLVERDWYVDGKDNDVFAFGEPYYDSMTGQMCVSAAVHVDYPKAVRVLAVDVYLDYVVGLVSEISGQGEVNAFLVTGEGQFVIAHPDTEMLMQTLGADGQDPLYGNIGQALSEGKTGLISIKGNDGSYYACLNPVENTDWYLVIYRRQSSVLSGLHTMELIMFVIAIAAAAALIFITMRITDQVVKPVQKVTNLIGKIADGDFSQDLEVRGNDEIARMSSNMQQFILQMRNTISEISHTADWLNRQSEENEKVSDSLRDSSQNQLEAMDMLTQMVEELSSAADEVSIQMEELAGLIHQANDEGRQAEDLMKESVVMSQGGKEDMLHINEGMTNISQSIGLLSEQISKVGTATAQIVEMVSIIMDIAEETNLLSLNASIEAARAGEAGRGFAIVAEQIGKLAANSSKAADDISGLTTDIRETVDEAVAQMSESVSKVESSVGIVAETSTTFAGLYEKVEETSRRVDSMIKLVDKVDTVAKQMEQITGNQMEATEQIAFSAEELSRHTEDVTTDSSTVARSAEELKKESMDLMERMSKFRL